MGCTGSKHDARPTLHSGQVYRGVKEVVFPHPRKHKHKVYEDITPTGVSQDAVIGANGAPAKRRSVGREDSLAELGSLSATTATTTTRKEGRTSFDDDVKWSKRRTGPRRDGKSEKKQAAFFTYEVEEDGSGTHAVRARSRSGHTRLRRHVVEPSSTSDEFPSVLMNTTERADRVESGSLSAGRIRGMHDPYSMGLMEEGAHQLETRMIFLHKPILPLEHRFSQDFRVRSLLEGGGDMISSWKYGPFPLVNDCSDELCISEYHRRRRMRTPSLDVYGVDGALDVSLHGIRAKDELFLEWNMQKVDISSASLEFFVEFLDPESRGVFAVAGVSPLCSDELLKLADLASIQPLFTNQIHVDAQMKSCFIRLWCIWNNGFCGSSWFFFDQRFMRVENGKHVTLHVVAD